ncbi:MAG: hypothetical protein H0X23_14555 [Rubrobacter sp.]|nr:hypothetical protein [Rubrobacter sp.]
MRGVGSRAPRIWTASGLVALALVTLLLPLLGDGGFSIWRQIVAYILALACVGVLFHGLLSRWQDFPARTILALGAGAAALGFPAALLASPEALAEGPAMLSLSALFLANALRLLAACALAFALARHVTSGGVALLIAGVATVSDLFSVFAGPTRTLIQEDSPALDFLLLVFPTFGQPAGFALGVSDFIFIALFAATSRFLNLNYTFTITASLCATFLAMMCGLILSRPLPALPFISLSFVLVNASPLLVSLRKPR